MEFIKEFIKYKESKGEKAIYRVNDTRGYTYYSDDYVKWLEQQLRLFSVLEQSEQLVSFLRQYQKACEIMHVNKIDAKNFVE